jgi:hypothetical protein
MRRMPRLRSAVILMGLALVAVGVGGLAVADPFHLRYAKWFTAGAVFVAIALVAAAFTVVARRGLLRGFVLVVGFAALAGWVVVVLLAMQLQVGNRETREIDDGGRRLLVLEAYPVLDPSYAVVVRAGGGPFEQESLVYQSVPDALPPEAVRFVDSDTVEVQAAGGCIYRSDIEAGTLAVSPVHRPTRIDAC